MKIQQLNYNNYSTTNKNNFNFRALHKTKLSNFQRVFVDMYKPPIEKMKNVGNLYQWAEERFAHDTVVDLAQGTRLLLDKWINKLLTFLKKQPADASLWKVAIYDHIKDPHYYDVPVFDEKILEKTMKDIENNQIKHLDHFHFMKSYEHKLKETTMEKYFGDPNIKTGWIKLPQVKNEKEGIETINDARNLSLGTNWCTKCDLYADWCLEEGDFYVYLKDGHTKLGIRTKNNQTLEIKNRYNRPQYSDLMQELNEFFEKYPDVVRYLDDYDITHD